MNEIILCSNLRITACQLYQPTQNERSRYQSRVDARRNLLKYVCLKYEFQKDGVFNYFLKKIIICIAHKMYSRKLHIEKKIRTCLHIASSSQLDKLLGPKFSFTDTLIFKNLVKQLSRKNALDQYYHQQYCYLRW